MTLVLASTQPWGVVEVRNNFGQLAVRGNIEVSLMNSDLTPAKHFADAAFSDPLTTTIRTNSDGEIDRYVEDGRYWMTVEGETKPVEATAGGTSRVGQEYVRVSDVETISRVGLGTTGTLSSGSVYAHRAQVKKTGTYSKLRIYTSGGATAVTDSRGGVWSSDGITKVAETGNESATVTTANTPYTLNLLVPIYLLAGDEVFLGWGQLGTTPVTMRGYASVTTFANMSGAPNIIRLATGWAGGALPNLSAGTSQGLWMALAP